MKCSISLEFELYIDRETGFHMENFLAATGSFVSFAPILVTHNFSHLQWWCDLLN